MGPLVLLEISALFWGAPTFKNRGHQRVPGYSGQISSRPHTTWAPKGSVLEGKIMFFQENPRLVKYYSVWPDI